MNYHEELLKRLNLLSPEEKGMYEQLRYTWLCSEATAEKMNYNEYYLGRVVEYYKEYQDKVKELALLTIDREGELIRKQRQAQRLDTQRMTLEAGAYFDKSANGLGLGEVL